MFEPFEIVLRMCQQSLFYSECAAARIINYLVSTVPFGRGEPFRAAGEQFFAKRRCIATGANCIPLQPRAN